jgi:FkbM family methyltransferase
VPAVRVGRWLGGGVTVKTVKLSTSASVGRNAYRPPAAERTPLPVCGFELEIQQEAPCGCPLRHVRYCGFEGHDATRCTRGPNDGRDPDIASCLTCNHHTYRAKLDAWPRRFDEHTLAPEVDGKRFNASIIEHGDGYLLAWRHGWQGSEVYLSRLDADFRETGKPVKLDLWHPDANYGREDPRLFRFNGRLHVSFIGVQGGARIGRTNQLYARLRDDLSVDQVFSPRYARRNEWEKNWQFFGHGGKLFAVYSVAPTHRVLAIDGDRAEVAYETPAPLAWTDGAMGADWLGGEIRGGAAPVLVGDEFWCWFHDRVELPDRHRVYRTGLYTFEARPPFRLRRIVPKPLLVADRRTKPADQYASVVFPGGAVRDGAGWVIAIGVHDRWTELHKFDHAEIERRLVTIAPPADFHWREEFGTDAGVWGAVYRRDEYRLGDTRFGPDDVVIDVGAHVGSFARAAWDRGARRVVCYEPSPANLDVLRKNAAAMPGVSVFPAAVGGTTTPRLYFNPRPTESARSDVGSCSPAPGGLEVPAVSLDAAIDAAGGRVAFLKMDCEGCEWPALFTATKLDRVDRIALEWHGGDPGQLADLLTAAGFRVEVARRPDGSPYGLLFAARPAPAGNA